MVGPRSLDWHSKLIPVFPFSQSGNLSEFIVVLCCWGLGRKTTKIFEAFEMLLVCSSVNRKIKWAFNVHSTPASSIPTRLLAPPTSYMQSNHILLASAQRHPTDTNRSAEVTSCGGILDLSSVPRVSGRILHSKQASNTKQIKGIYSPKHLQLHPAPHNPAWPLEQNQTT